MKRPTRPTSANVSKIKGLQVEAERDIAFANQGAKNEAWARELNDRASTLKRCSQELLALLSPPSLPQGEEGRGGIYVASRASVLERGQMWRECRANGSPIISSWIDEDGQNDTAALDELWTRILREVTGASRLVLYVEPSDFPLKGAFVEIGMALASKVPITIVAPGVEITGRNQRPFGSWIKHPLVSFANTVEQALSAISNQGKPSS